MAEKQVSDFGPNATRAGEAPPVTCPVCGEIVKAVMVGEHGKRHIAEREASK